MKKFKILLLLLLALVAGSMQAQEGFDPTNPPDPHPTYKVTVRCTPDGTAYTSGNGRFKTGESVYIYSSSYDPDFEFKYWMKDGEEYSRSSSFYYTVQQEDATFTAVYELRKFDPDSPSDPMAEYKSKLYLTAEPYEACSFNYSNGSRIKAGEWISLYAYYNQGFVFRGWYDSDGTLLSTSINFSYEMPLEDAHITARFKFDPTSPDDPFNNKGQTDVDMGLRGDVNGDGVVDATDATHVVNLFLNGSEYDKNADLNGDGVVDATDATAIINIYLDK